jgi:UDP-glucose 4-epimerase
MSGKSALVTGGLGFIGSNLAHLLVSLGAKVTVYDACLDPYGWNFANIREIRDKVGFVKADVRDAGKIAAAVKGQDFVFHCAAQVSHSASMSDPFLDVDINCNGTLRLLEACRKHADGAKIIHAGTRGQIGRQVYSPVDEAHPTDPADIYGIDKLAAEKYCLLYGSTYGMRACSLRINNTYGPRHQMRHAKFGVLNWFVRLALEGKALTVFGKGGQVRDYNYVDDVSAALALAAQKGRSDGQVYNLGSGRRTRFVDMAKAVVKAAGSGRVESVPWPEGRRRIEVGDFFVSYAKIRRELGWAPKVGLEEGLEKTVGFYRERLKEYV